MEAKPTILYLMEVDVRCRLPIVSAAKFLGVELDECLTWGHHVQYFTRDVVSP